MITPFFSTEERIAALLEEADSWIGTPFLKYSSVKGKGVDCVRLLGTMLANVQAIPPVDWDAFPPYRLDWSAHHDEPLLEQAIESLQLKHERIEKGKPLQIGDVMLFAPGKVVYHLGMYRGRNQFIHVLDSEGGGAVQYVSTGNKVLDRFYRYSLRPMEEVAS